MTSNDFNDIAEKIIKLFPNERKETYFVPPMRVQNHSVNSKGKLPDKYRNLKHYLKCTDDTTTEERTSDQNLCLNSITGNVKKKINFLKHNIFVSYNFRGRN